MTWLLGGYMWLYLHRPFEYYTILGDLQLERCYMILMLLVWLATPGKRLPPNRLHAAFVLFTVSLLLCWLLSPYATHGDKVWDDYWKVGVFYVLLVTTHHDEKRLKRLLFVYLAALGLYMAHSLLEYTNGRYDYKQATHRMVGVDKTGNDPNTFAATVLHALPFVLPFWVTDCRPTRRAFWLAFVGLAALCILLTGSRRGFLGLGLLMVLLTLMSRHRFVLLLLMGLAAPLVLTNLRDDLQNRLMTLVDRSYGPDTAIGSEKFRYLAFWEGLRLWEQSPLFGLGPGSFRPAAGHDLEAHNLYAQTISEMGTLGVLSLTALVGCFLLNLVEVRRTYAREGWPRRDFLDELTKATFLAVVLLLLMGLGGHNLFRYNWMWFAAFQVQATACVRARAAACVEADGSLDGFDAEPEPEPPGPGTYVYPAAA